MSVVAFVAPFFTENARRFVRALAALDGVALGLVSQEPIERLPDEVRSRIRAFVQVDDALAVDRLIRAARRVAGELGPIARLTAAIEQIQIPLAEARAELGLPGLTADEARNFRDKRRMKDLLRAAGLPVARHCLAETLNDARRFAAGLGYPVVVKPPEGVASQTTYRVDDEAALVSAVTAASAAAKGPILVEEFLKGDEHSFVAFIHEGKVVFHSISNYFPTPLDVMQNPWMQWIVVLPRELDVPEFDEIRAAGERALQVLGLRSGMCHLEWFRRDDGTIAISEVGARPPGAQFTTMISRAHDVDCLGAWAKMEAFGTFEPFPPRRYAAGAAYLRGQGQGRVRAVRGIDVVHRDVGHLVTDARIPEIGQEKAASYEGEGYVLVRDPDTRVVANALRHIVSTVRVELG
jgi:hypothetical protein